LEPFRFDDLDGWQQVLDRLRQLRELPPETSPRIGLHSRFRRQCRTYQEPRMHDWFAMETEAAYRRQEWKRCIAAEAKEALVRRERDRWGGWRLPSLSLPALKRNWLARRGFGATASTGPHERAACEATAGD
jgi:arylsulfatase A-like enzyme